MKKIIKKYLLNINLLFLFIIFFTGYWFMAYNRSQANSQASFSIKKIKFNENIAMLPLLADTTHHFKDYIKVASPSNKIILMIDAGCSTCIETLTKWNDLLKTNNINYEKVIIFGYGADYVRLKYIQSQLPGLRSPIFIDNMFAMGMLNGISENSIYKTLLVDKNFNILAAGNPFSDPLLLNTYINSL